MPRIVNESQAEVSTIAKAVGSRVVVTVCTESQPAALVKVVLTTPVSAGLQDVSASKVESLLLMTIKKLATESQPLIDPPMIVSLNNVSAKYHVPKTFAESHAIRFWLEVLTRSKVVVTVCTESQPAVFVKVVLTTPVSAGLQEVSASKVESLKLIVRLKVVIESHPLAAPPMMVSFRLADAVNVNPRIVKESQAEVSTVAKAVGSNVVVTVCTESQPAALVKVVLTTPVSAGLQEVSASKVESLKLIVRLKVVIESHPLAAPATIVSLNEVEAV